MRQRSARAGPRRPGSRRWPRWAASGPAARGSGSRSRWRGAAAPADRRTRTPRPRRARGSGRERNEEAEDDGNDVHRPIRATRTLSEAQHDRRRGASPARVGATLAPRSGRARQPRSIACARRAAERWRVLRIRPSPSCCPASTSARTSGRCTTRLAPVLEKITRSFEVIFVDDGSTDGCSEMLDALNPQDPRFKVIHFSRNFGHQAALSAGLDASTGAAVVLMDCDLQDPPEVIESFIDALAERLRGRLRRPPEAQGGHPQARGLRGLLPLDAHDGPDRRAARRRRLLPDGPQGGRRAEASARVAPLPARPALLGRLPPGRRRVRARRAATRGAEVHARQAGAAGGLRLRRASRPCRCASRRGWASSPRPSASGSPSGRSARSSSTCRRRAAGRARSR